MQISSLDPALIPSSGLTDIGSSGRAAKHGWNESSAAQTVSAPAGEAERERAGGGAETVSVSAGAQTLQTIGVRDLPAPVYAEIWKGDMKLAEIDIHGHVTSFSGLVPSGRGSAGGALVAAQRAVQMAQLTGGEIRAAGQVIDGKTLLMRARLANAYVR